MGTDLWTPVAVPSVGVLCSRAWWEASSESPWVFGDASLLHDLKRLCLFRRDEVPARNAHRQSGFAFTPRKKFLRDPRGVFSKTRPWQGVGQRPAKRGKASLGARLFRRDKIPARNTNRPSGFAFTHLKKFLRVPRGVFPKTRPWQGAGQRPTKRIKQKTRPDRLKSQASLSSGFTGKDHSSFSSTTFLAQMISKFPLRQRRSLRKARSSF